MWAWDSRTRSSSSGLNGKRRFLSRLSPRWPWNSPQSMSTRSPSACSRWRDPVTSPTPPQNVSFTMAGLLELPAFQGAPHGRRLVAGQAQGVHLGDDGQQGPRPLPDRPQVLAAGELAVVVVGHELVEVPVLELPGLERLDGLGVEPALAGQRLELGQRRGQLRIVRFGRIELHGAILPFASRRAQGALGPILLKTCLSVPEQEPGARLQSLIEAGHHENPSLEARNRDRAG